MSIENQGPGGEASGHEVAIELLPAELVEKVENFYKRDAEIVGASLVAEKIELLLVLLGEKPVGTLEIYGDYKKAGSKKYEKDREAILLSEVDKAKNLLDEIGLHYVISGNDMQKITDSDGRVIVSQDSITLYVARDEEKLVNISGTISHEDSGRLFGFPETAIEAFLDKKEKMPREELPDEVRNSECYPFLQFVVSRENWPQEIKTAERWAEVIKVNSPKLFEELRSGWPNLEATPIEPTE